MVTPSTAVDGVGAVKLPTPPTADVYHLTPIPLAHPVMGPDAAPRQNDVSCTLGGGVEVGGNTVSKNVLVAHAPAPGLMPVMVYVIMLVIPAVKTPLLVPVVASR